MILGYQSVMIVTRNDKDFVSHGFVSSCNENFDGSVVETHHSTTFGISKP